MPVIGLSMTPRYLRPLRFILPIVSCDSKLSIRRWRLHFRYEDATTDDSHTKAMRSLTGSLTYYSSIVAIINQHHISSSRPFIQAKREKKKGRNQPPKIDREFRRCKWNRIIHLCVDVRVHWERCTCVFYETRGRPRRTRRSETGTKFTFVDTFHATKSRRLRFEEAHRFQIHWLNGIDSGNEVIACDFIAPRWCIGRW